MTWVLADPHAGADESADRALIDLLADARAKAADLLIMGDLFVAWVGIDRFFTDLQRQVLERLEAIRRAGATIRFVAGNRDYLAERMVGKAFDEVLSEETVIDLDGVRTLVVHGDRLNLADRPYRAWYRVSRSRAATTILDGLPGRVGRRVTREIEERMRGTNLAYKTGALPMEGLRAIAERARARGAERVLLGHFHTPTTIECAVPVIIAPGWIEHHVVLDGRSLSPTGS